MKLPAPLEAVIEALQQLPGVGAKSAQRMALHLLKEGPEAMNHLGDLLHHAAEKVGFCECCGAFADQPLCPVCADPRRDPAVLMVVAEASNVLSFERGGHFRGRYHVLGGLISPLKGLGPDQLRIRELLKRLEDGAIREIVLATNPTLDGEATAAWLARILEPVGMSVSRIGVGLPIGSDLEYADDLTLDRALEGRRKV
ncbi:MAG: recombination protein RecR [Holophagaceae bacterium]|nr:recombination protein RecR [Holophagaceae bacterium]